MGDLGGASGGYPPRVPHGLSANTVYSQLKGGISDIPSGLGGVVSCRVCHVLSSPLPGIIKFCSQTCACFRTLYSGVIPHAFPTRRPRCTPVTVFIVHRCVCAGQPGLGCVR